MLSMTNKLRIKDNKINIISKSLKQASVQNFLKTLARFKGSNTEMITNKICAEKNLFELFGSNSLIKVIHHLQKAQIIFFLNCSSSEYQPWKEYLLHFLLCLKWILLGSFLNSLVDFLVVDFLNLIHHS